MEGSAEDLPRCWLVKRTVDRRSIAPQAEQIEFAIVKGLPDTPPHVGVPRHARPAAVRGVGRAVSEQRFEHQRIYPRRLATCRNNATRTPGRKTPAMATRVRCNAIGARRYASSECSLVVAPKARP